MPESLTSIVAIAATSVDLTGLSLPLRAAVTVTISGVKPFFWKMMLVSTPIGASI